MNQSDLDLMKSSAMFSSQESGCKLVGDQLQMATPTSAADSTGSTNVNTTSQPDPNVVHVNINFEHPANHSFLNPKQVTASTSASPFPVNVVNKNPGLSALLHDYSRNNNEETSIATVNELEQHVPNQSFRFDPSEISIRDFLSDSSNYSLSPIHNNVTTDMLVNYDKSKYTAIPLDTTDIFRSSPINQQTPFTLVGSYNMLNEVGNLTPSAPLNYSHSQPQVSHASQFEPQSRPLQQQQQQSFTGSSGPLGNPLRTIMLECSEALDSEGTSTTPEESESGSGSGNGSMFINLKHGGSFVCNICQGRFYTKEYLEYHLIVVHNIRYMDQGQGNLSSTKLSPKSNATMSSVEFQNHSHRMNALRATLQLDAKPKAPNQNQSQNQDRLFYCQRCSKTYTYLRNLRKHEIAIHSGAEGGNLLQNPSHLKNATYTATSANAFVSNSNSTHGGTRPLEIPGTTKRLSKTVIPGGKERTKKSKSKTPSQLVQSKVPVQLSECRVCHEMFADQGALIIHTKKHVSTCSVCFKMFGSKRGLKLHSSIHNANQEKPYGCELCDRQYSHSRSLKHHMNQRHPAGPSVEQQPQEQKPEITGSVTATVNDGVQIKNDEGSGTAAEEKNEYISFCFGRIEEMKTDN